jgi:hypothetical protein
LTQFFLHKYYTLYITVYQYIIFFLPFPLPKSSPDLLQKEKNQISISCHTFSATITSITGNHHHRGHKTKVYSQSCKHDWLEITVMVVSSDGGEEMMAEVGVILVLLSATMVVEVRSD